jgi:L-ascorbate metabolism protein UlaG (beta-lactamase superfamily)
VRAWLGYRFSPRPSLERCGGRVMTRAEESPGQLRVTFLGVSTLLFEDGKTAILTDGFFTRPGRLRTLLTKIAPDRKLIGRYLERAGIKELAAVVVLHSHHDHSLDAPEVALQTDADLIGSESTANIARGYEPAQDKILAQDKVKVVHGGESFEYGRFRITVLRSRHSPISLLTHLDIHQVLFDGEITTPLHSPARLTDYKEGGSYAVLIEHDGKRMLVQGSAGFDKDALRGLHAEVVFLGVGTLGKLNDKYRDDYWRETVEAVGARRVFPIHWDDFFVSLDEPLRPMPLLLDDFDKTMTFLLARAGQEETKVDVKLLPAWIKVDPFAGLEITK